MLQCIDLLVGFYSVRNTWDGPILVHLNNSQILTHMPRLKRYIYIKSCNTFSDCFKYSVGLKKRGVISPTQIFYFQKVFLQHYISSGSLIKHTVIIVLLFADDIYMVRLKLEYTGMVTPQIKSLTFCSQWSLEVNLDKTKSYDRPKHVMFTNG